MAFCVSKRTLRFCRLCGMLAGGDYRRRLMRMSGEAVQIAASSSGDRLSPTLPYPRVHTYVRREEACPTGEQETVSGERRRLGRSKVPDNTRDSKKLSVRNGLCIPTEPRKNRKPTPYGVECSNTTRNGRPRSYSCFSRASAGTSPTSGRGRTARAFFRFRFSSRHSLNSLSNERRRGTATGPKSGV